VVRDYLWAAEFGLAAFARKFAARADVYGTAACLTRAMNQLILVVFVEIAEIERAPPEFARRVQETLAQLGNSAAELDAAVVSIERLLEETVGVTNGLYQSRYTLLK